MKRLVRIGDVWVDRSVINGVVKEGDHYRVTVGEHGLQIPHDLTKEEASRVLYIADIAGFGV